MTPEQPLPSHYNDLEGTLAYAIRLLARGVKDRRSAFHTLTIGTTGSDGEVRLRTVVNRGFDQASRTLRFHTDARAPKLVELRADPRAAVHIYDARAKIQLRLSTRAMLHPDGDLKAEAWQATRPFSRECYRVIPSPGDSVTDPEAVPFQATDDTEAGLENFVPVTLQVTVLEWLFLAHQGHRRARFTWAEDGTLSQDWLVP